MYNNKPSILGNLLLEIGALLMSSGANTNRIRLTMSRIADSYNYKADFLITHRAIILTLKDTDGNQLFNQLKQSYGQVPNFRMVSGISRLSWRIVEEKLTANKAWEEVERLKSLPQYPRPLILLVVAIACSSFCRLGGGNVLEMLAVFGATFLGLYLKQVLTKIKVNTYFNVFLSAFFTTMISGGIASFFPFEHDNMALITSILYLIPGIPLINSISDFLDGNTLNGFVRAVNGLVTSFAIASGLLIAVLIYNVL